MKKRFTLLSTALLVASLSAGAASSVEWKEGNYYQLQSGEFCLAVDGIVSDSVIVKKKNVEDPTKASLDSTLWQVTKRTTSGGIVYQFRNKATNALLAFAAKENATTKLDPSGVSEWAFSDGGAIKGYFGDGKSYSLSISTDVLSLSATTASNFNIETTDPYTLKSDELGNGISTFYMDLGGEYEGDIFSGKELIAKDINDGYLMIQYKDDQEFPDGKAKYLGVDSVKTTISGATGSYGLQFKADSTYEEGALHSYSNEEAQQFKFEIDLSNDSIAVFVKSVSGSAGEVKIVYAELGNNKVLTVSEKNSNQGKAPFITTRRGTPVTLANGSGVYFLKNVGKTANAGKYLYGNEVYTSETPSVYNPDGQWYVKEENGKYSIVDRLKGTTYASNSEIFAVNGVSGAYTVAGRTDTLSFEYQPKVDLKDKYLGILRLTEAELKEKTIQLNVNAVGGTVPISVSDSLLLADMEKEATSFRLFAGTEEKTAGAQSLGDTLYTVSYRLVDQFGDRVLVKDSKTGSLIMSSYQKDPLGIVFRQSNDGTVYEMTVGKEYVTYSTQSNLLLSEEKSEAVEFDVNIIDAPQYETVESSHLRFGSNGKYLTMNPLTLWAELKNEGQEITKADYTADNFSFKIEKADTVIPGKPVYLISTCMIGADDETSDVRYYLSAIDTVQHEGKNRLGFIPSNDTIRTSKNSPAYFSLKKNEDGSLWLENINVKGGAFVSQIANTLVMSNTGMNFSAEKASAPTANEEIEAPTSVVVAGGHNSVTVMNAKDKKIVLTDILGKIVGNYLVTSDRFTVPASRGLLIVAIEGEVAQKVIVK